MKLVVHKFIMGDVEDPEIYAAEPIMEFERSEKGQWLHEHSEKQMEFEIQPDPHVYGYSVHIQAWLSEENLTYFKLKWS